MVQNVRERRLRKMNKNDQKIDWENLFITHPSLSSDPPEVQKDVLSIIMPLFNESDRGAVLVGVARLDEVLSDLHKDFIAQTVANSKTIINDLFKPYSPLSSFAGKIQIAYAYGLIGADVHADLNRIRKIRNLAAHSGKDFSFESEEVRKSVAELTAIKRVSLASPTDKPDWYTISMKIGDAIKTHFVTHAVLLQAEIVMYQNKRIKRRLAIMKLIEEGKITPKIE
jgi:DNA-binding MltR family transcriptional regulator